jgi:hypothetical protein
MAGFCENLATLAHHDVEALRLPACLVKIAHAAPYLLGTGRRRRSQHLRARLFIPEQPRLACHHEMLRRGKAIPLDGEWSRKPLAQAAFAH